MRIALFDNGSLEPAAHLALRAAAAALSGASGRSVDAVSWRHSDRIDPGRLDGAPAATLASWIRSWLARGESEFVLVPFLASVDGAIAAAVRRDLDALKAREGGFRWTFTPGLGTAGLAQIVEARVREALARHALDRPAVVLVDHGGPVRASAELRDAVAGQVRTGLGAEVSRLACASMETPPGPGFDFNRPLFEELLGSPGFDRGEVVVAPLFLSPGRHAGPSGDLAGMARQAERRSPGLRCLFAGLVGTHPLAAEILSGGLLELLPAPAIL